MARRKRRDEDAVDKRLDQETDETPDEAAEDSSDDALDPDDDIDDELESEDDDPDDDEDEEPAGRRGGTAVKRAKAGSDSETKSKTRPGKGDKAGKSKRPERVGPIGRLLRFIREVVAELRKVIWPTRKELLTYTVVVVVFVSVMLAIIALFDLGFARAMLWVFGSNTAQE